jgi:PAS domain S-box-containing protein
MEPSNFPPEISSDNFASLIEADSSEILSVAFESLPDGVFLFDSNKCLTRVNAAGVRLENAADAASLVGQSCCRHFWRVEGTAECVVDRALTSGDTIEVEMLVSACGDCPIILTVIPILNVTPIEDSETVMTGSAIVIARDVSALRRAEAEAFEHKAFMTGLADLAPDEIYTLDTQGRLTWMNERARNASGLSLTVLQDNHFRQLIAEESRDEARRNIERTLAGEETQCELRAVHIDGTARYVEAYAAPRWKDGSVIGAFVFLRDLTERKRTQERMAQSDKLRAVGELAAGVAHNLNNSLTVIQARAQLLMRRTQDEATTKSLEVITRAVSDGAKTLQRILNFARRDADRKFARVDLAELVASSVEIARPKWENKTREREGAINVTIENQGAVYVMGDAAELREVILNLLFNAVDALPQGGTIETGARGELDAARFWVADTGCGMPPEVVERIFDPFYTTKGENGTGLGLSASHGIIARHNGQIMVVSEAGEGTRFEISLPIDDRGMDN